MVKAIGAVKTRRVRLLPKNTEKIITFGMGVYDFKDSFSFLTSSLCNLVQMLKKSNHNFPLLQKFYSGKQLEMATQKSYYPYDLVESIPQLESMKKLPPRSTFYSMLTGDTITEEEYSFAKSVWNEFQITDMKMYTKLYCEIDVLLLAEVFLTFCETFQKQFKLDPAHFISLPSYSYTTMLHLTGIKLQAPPSVEIYEFIQKNLRGGHAYINIRHCQSNRPDQTTFDKNKDPSDILYVDANNLYGWAMSQKMPVDGIRFMSEKEIEELYNGEGINFWELYNHEGEDGYIVECDLKYPKELHESHAGFPLAPENIIITDDHLSKFSKKCRKILNQTGRFKEKKLTATFLDREKYVVHGGTLSLYLSLGMKIVKVHRVLTFKQSYFLRDYVSLCTELRAKSNTVFEKNLFKLMVNSVFGKFSEGLFDRMKINVCKTDVKLMKYAGSSMYVRSKIVEEDVVLAHSKQKIVTLCRSNIVAFSILDYSKYWMYLSFYKFIRIKIPKCEVILSDTDSFLLYVKTDNIDKELKKLTHIFDFSNYPTDHKFYDDSKKNMLGYFKDEMCGQERINESCGLRAKCYTFKTDKKQEKKTCKGVSKNIVKKNIKFQDYVDCIKKIQNYSTTMYVLRSHDHKIGLEEIKKLAFSSFDSKRHLLPCNIHTIPYGHYLIKNNVCKCPYCEHICK